MLLQRALLLLLVLKRALVLLMHRYPVVWVALAGTLTFIVGGTDAQFQKAQPILECMGKNIFHAGDHGAGQIAKVCNNMLLGILMAGTCEALNMGVKNGLDPKVLSDIMKQSSGNNWALQVYNPVPGVMDGVPASRKLSGWFPG